MNVEVALTITNNIVTATMCVVAATHCVTWHVREWSTLKHLEMGLLPATLAALLSGFALQQAYIATLRFINAARLGNEVELGYYWFVWLAHGMVFAALVGVLYVELNISPIKTSTVRVLGIYISFVTSFWLVIFGVLINT